MSNILDRYIKKFVLLNICIIFFILMSLSSIVRVVDGLHDFNKKNYSIYNICTHLLLSLPKDLELFLPVSVLLGSLLALNIFETRNELIIMKVFGVSNVQIAFSVIKISIVILLLNIFFIEWLFPYTQNIVFSQQYYRQYNIYLFPEKNKNLWLVDKSNFISIEYMPNPYNLLGVNLYYFTKNKNLEKIVQIEQAIYKNKAWFVCNITELNFSKKNSFTNKRILNYKWDTTLTPKILSIINTDPRLLSIFELSFCIKYFNDVGQNSKYYQLVFWNKVLSPFIGIIMVIIALLYNFKSCYHKKMGVRLFFGSVISFLFYIVHQVFSSLSIIYNISPLVGSIFPIILFLVVNIIVLWRYFKLFRY